jgi:hypothetical protein
LKWDTPSSGGMTLISEQTPSAVSSLSFSSISGTYKQLMLIWSGIQFSAAGTIFAIRLNNNSGTIYKQYFVGENNGVFTTVDADNDYIGNGTFPSFGVNNDATAIRNDTMGTLVIDNYASSTRPKYMKGGWTGKSSTTGTRWVNYSGIFDDTTAITSIDIVRTVGSATFSTVNNSSIRLYGIS